MEKEKTVQLLEQLNCKMDKIINLLENQSIKVIQSGIDIGELAQSLTNAFSKTE